MVDVIRKKVELNRLYFDPENPRLPQKLIGTSNEASVIDFMVKHGNVTELMQSIGQTGFSVAEPLLVVPKSIELETSGMEYYVVEGNRRLAALKLLANPSLSSLRKKQIYDIVDEAYHIPKTAPVLIYPTRMDILDYLGYRHITGVKDWGALEKARYLDQLFKTHIEEYGREKIYSVLAKMIGSRTDYVSKLHTALKLYEYANDQAYFGADIEEDDINFSWITTALSYSGTVKHLGLSDPGDSELVGLRHEEYSQFFIWLFDPKRRKVKESREISHLNEIIKSSPALEKLQRGSSISEALLYTSHPNETFNRLIIQAKETLLNAKDITEQLNSEPENIIELLEEIEKICKTIKGSIVENFKTSNEKSVYQLSELTPEQIQRILKLIDDQGE